MKRTSYLWLLGAVVLGGVAGSSESQTALAADGVVESTSGGFRFPDRTVQITAASPAALGKTGQQACWDANYPIACEGTGQDGELQRGVDWPTPRFTDNGNGTVTDELTGLIWLLDANCPLGELTWQAALNWVDDLNTIPIACTDYTAMTFSDWRLPNIKELWSLVDLGESSPALPSGYLFANVEESFYWSSSTRVESPSDALFMGFSDGVSGSWAKAGVNYVWPVRGGR